MQLDEADPFAEVPAEERVKTPEELEALMRREEARARIALARNSAFYGYVVGRNEADWQEIAALHDRPQGFAITTDDIRDVWNALFDGHELLCRMLNVDPTQTTVGDAQEAMLERLTGQRGAEGWAELRRGYAQDSPDQD